MTTGPCLVCGGATITAGTVQGRLAERAFDLERCPDCGFARVADPLHDLSAIYDMAYYEGRGADPLVDYVTELKEPDKTVRVYEWDGVLDAVRGHVAVGPDTRWLDFGCGNGGLVRHLDRELGCDVVGWDEGEIVQVARNMGINIVEDERLDELGPFDVITAIEVMEHVLDPAATIRRVAELLAPGGLFFYTTGNVAPHREKIDSWPYVIPEIHVSFFEPRTMSRLLTDAGLDPVEPRWRGWPQIYRFKIFKNLKRRRRSWLSDHLPIGPLARVFDRRRKLSAFPPARRRQG
jgi:SAM-dependent methyltransferase